MAVRGVHGLNSMWMELQSGWVIRFPVCGIFRTKVRQATFCILYQSISSNWLIEPNRGMIFVGHAQLNGEKENNMNLSAPTTVVFVITLVIAALGLLAGLGVLAIIPVSAFWLMTIAYGVLAIACVLKGM